MESNKIPLNKALAERIANLVGSVRTSTVELASIAADIRNQHLDPTGKKYDKEFQTFWKNYSMELNFGSLSNFTKYANAGDAIALVRTQYVTYEKRLPTSLTALYEFSQLTKEEMELCLETTYSRTEVTADRSKWKSPKKPKPLIAPTVKAADIKGWRTKWRNPKAPAADKRRLKIAEIKVHGSLYDFKAGNHIGVITLDQIHQISEALKNVVASFPDLIIRLDLEDEKLIQGYEKRQAAEIKKAENKVKVSEKPAATKRGIKSKP